MRGALWRKVVALAILMTFILLYLHYNKPVVEVEYRNNTPENYRNKIGQKVIDPGDLPPEKYKKVFRFVMIVEDAIGFDCEAYLAAFPKDAVKKSETKNDSRAVIFSDYRPNFEEIQVDSPEEGFRVWQECKRRAKWLRE